MKSESIILIGMAGAGKSTIGMLLAGALGFDFIDLDDYIEAKDGKKLQEIIDAEGEEAFLQMEKQRMYEIDLSRTVVAPGGSIIYHSDLMGYLRQCTTLVHLDNTFENIEERLTDVLIRGVVGLKNKSLKQIYNERRPLYSSFAHITVTCQGKSQGQLAKEILQCYSNLKK